MRFHCIFFFIAGFIQKRGEDLLYPPKNYFPPGNILVFCHRRLVVVNLFYFSKGHVKSPILHTTMYESDFCVPNILRC